MVSGSDPWHVVFTYERETMYAVDIGNVYMDGWTECWNFAQRVKMTRPKYFTPNEVAIHNTVDDLWVSFLGKVYDLTTLCEKYKGL